MFGKGVHQEEEDRLHRARSYAHRLDRSQAHSSGVSADHPGGSPCQGTQANGRDPAKPITVWHRVPGSKNG
jgi:hypothetical protein